MTEATQLEGFYNPDETEAFRAIARQHTLPLLQDQATQYLLETGQNFTFVDRSTAASAILIGTVMEFLIWAAGNAPNACDCVRCTDKRLAEMSKVFLLGLTRTIGFTVRETEE